MAGISRADSVLNAERSIADGVVTMVNMFHGVLGSGFMPHGGCYLWSPGIIALHVVSDALIVLAYYSIPVTLVYFVRKRTDLSFHWMFVCFAVFILACGTTHLMEIWNIWHADYWLAGGLKALTAVASVPTSILLVKLIPPALALPSPQALQTAYGELEERVAERTLQLKIINDTLVREASERERAEREARESVVRLRAVLDSTFAAVVLADSKGDIIEWNARAETIFGWTRTEAIGRELADTIIPSPYRDAHRRGMARFVAAGEGVVLNRLVEMTGLRRDGTQFPAELFISPLTSGDTVTFCGFITDITERKRGELASAQLAAIVSSSDDAIVGTGLDGIIESWNAGAERLFGYSAGEMRGRSVAPLIPFEGPEEEANMLERIGRGEGVQHFEGIRQAKDRRLINVSVAISPIKDSTGKIVGASKVLRDITERKRAEEQLRVSSKEIVELKAALDEHAIVAITDDRGIITYVNDKFCEISRYPREELLGQDHRLINSGHHPKEFIRELWGTIAHGRVWHGELKNKAKDGSFYWVDTTIVPFLNEAGKPRQYVAVRADITKHKAAESEILRLNTALEERVAKRTTELETANRELEAFSYSISHDLRAPLRAVNGFADIALEDFGSQLPEACRSLLVRVRDRGRLMGQLIDDLLEFSRLSQQSLRRQPVNVTALVHAVLDELTPQSEGRQMDVQVGELPECLADPALAKQIWVNLLSNAIKYTRDQELAIVEVGCVREKGENVFFVRDNGVGFDMQYANKLFGVFHRLHRDEEFEGTGVGLAIVQRIVHRHGGRVWAEAELDRGATFHFTLEEVGGP